jgi:hypothetical protein
MTTSLEGGEGPVSCPGRSLAPGKTRYPLYRRLGGPQGRSGQVRKISPPPGFFFRRSPDRPARSHSLYRLRYPAHVLPIGGPISLFGILHTGQIAGVYSTAQNTEHPLDIPFECGELSYRFNFFTYLPQKTQMNIGIIT